MPAKLVTGQKADDVAAYVASVVAKPGKDTGLLANAVPAAAQPGRSRQERRLSIDADPGGQLLFTASKATAPAGKITIKFANTSGVPHNIAIDGQGQDADHAEGQRLVHRDLRARHLHLLLRGARPRAGRA